MDHTASSQSMANFRPWSKLPNEILELFLKPLFYSDRVRFGGTCTSWRLAAAASKCGNHVPEPPWLLLSKPSKNNQVICFFSLTERKVYHINLPMSQHARCIGSSNGWLVITDYDGGRNCLLNPFTHEQARLPCASRNMPLLHCCGSNFHKAVLLAAPTAENTAAVNCLVVVVHSENRLSLCRPGDQGWLALPLPEDYRGLVCCEDVLFHDGLLYALFYGGELVIYRLDSKPIAAQVYRPPEVISGSGELYALYLVEFCGELLMAVRHFRFAIDAGGHTSNVYTTFNFTLFKFDRNVPEWVGVKSLGNGALLLGAGCSRSFLAGKNSGFRPNCIYFTDISCWNLQHPDVGVFCLEDKSILPFLPNNLGEISPLSVWFSPNS